MSLASYSQTIPNKPTAAPSVIPMDTAQVVSAAETSSFNPNHVAPEFSACMVPPNIAIARYVKPKRWQMFLRHFNP